MHHHEAVVSGRGDRPYKRFAQEVAAADLPVGPGAPDVVCAAEVAALPDAAQRYLTFMGVVGAPRHWSFTARFHGRFRLRRGLGWMLAEAWQYNSAIGVARIFVMRIRFAGVVPMTGVDRYLRGRGRKLGKLLGLVTVADGQGGEFDVGELTTYLNDAVLLAPSLLLRAGTEWNQLSDSTFEVALSDRGHRVSGRVTIDERGAPIDFTTTDRFADLPGGLRRAEWHTPITGWSQADSRPRPEGVCALWRLPEGDLPYIEGRIDDVVYDQAPGVPPAADRRHWLSRAGFGAAQLAVVVPAAPLLRRWFNRWGATGDEAEGSLPGDELVPDAQMSSTRAITIDAPPAEVWPRSALSKTGRSFVASKWLDKSDSRQCESRQSATELPTSHRGGPPHEGPAGRRAGRSGPLAARRHSRAARALGQVIAQGTIPSRVVSLSQRLASRRCLSRCMLAVISLAAWGRMTSGTMSLPMP
jgi:hypothetical protein